MENKTYKMFFGCSGEPTVQDKIRLISETYSKKSQWEKTIEELYELLDELHTASNPFGYESCVYFTDKVWDEAADVLIMITQLIMQHKASGEVKAQVSYKVDRQLARMYKEGLLTDVEVPAVDRGDTGGGNRWSTSWQLGM